MRTLISLICLFLLLCGNVFADNFVLNSLTEAQKLSNETKKPILLILGSDSCNFCSLLKNDLDSVLKKDVDNFIVCYLDLKSDPELKKQYNVSLMPDSRIISNGKMNYSIKGYKQRDYKKWLENVK
jgi:thioredoxin-related protein